MSRVSRSIKGCGGKCVTLVTGLRLDSAAINKLAKQLKQICGADGTVKNDTIEIQGDHLTLISDELKRRGYAVKLSGG